MKPEASGNTALGLYRGKVMHARISPVAHRFTYAMDSILIDIDRLDEAAEASPLFSVNRFNLLSFHERDHGPRDGTPLREYVASLLAGAGLSEAHRIRLLCYPRFLGYGFNPLSVYFCEDDSGALIALLYEVRNTFGGMHTYVEPVREGQISPAGVRQQAGKLFHVSPFMDMDMIYHFRVRPPGQDVAIRILETQGGNPVLAAAFHGDLRAAGTMNFLRSLLQTAGLTWKVMAGIHFEALRLWLKGIGIRRRPDSDGATGSAVSFAGSEDTACPEPNSGHAESRRKAA